MTGSSGGRTERVGRSDLTRQGGVGTAEVVHWPGFDGIGAPQGGSRAARLGEDGGLLVAEGDGGGSSIARPPNGIPVLCDAEGSSRDRHDARRPRLLRRIARSQALKRLADLLLGAVVLLLSSPLMVLIAVAVKLDSRGPIFYRQLRHGQHGQVFPVIKFRTMLAERCDAPDVPIVQARPADSRVTRVGRFLRRRNLDELPQILNVLSGTMSLVGPRPHPVSFLDLYSPDIPNYADRLAVRPGITGWAQVHGLRGETRSVDEMRRRVDHDLYYVRQRGLGLDLKILWLTLATFDSPHAY